MQKLHDLLGLPILEIETGMQIGEVREVILDIEMASVIGIMISGSSWFTDNQGFLFHDLFSIGRDAVTIRSSRKAIAEFISSEVTCSLKELLNKQIFTETGLNLGVLVDVLFEPSTGEIKAYQVSDGIITDLIHGRMLMPLPQVQVVGGDKLIVPETMAKLIHPEPQE